MSTKLPVVEQLAHLVEVDEQVGKQSPRRHGGLLIGIGVCGALPFIDVPASRRASQGGLEPGELALERPEHRAAQDAQECPSPHVVVLRSPQASVSLLGGIRGRRSKPELFGRGVIERAQQPAIPRAWALAALPPPYRLRGPAALNTILHVP